MRLGEILALTRNDLDLARGVIHVLDAKAGTRMAHMTESVRAMFAELPGGPPSAPLFPSVTGGEPELIEGEIFRTIVPLGSNVSAWVADKVAGKSCR